MIDKIKKALNALFPDGETGSGWDEKNLSDAPLSQFIDGLAGQWRRDWTLLQRLRYVLDPWRTTFVPELDREFFNATGELTDDERRGRLESRFKLMTATKLRLSVMTEILAASGFPNIRIRGLGWNGVAESPYDFFLDAGGAYYGADGARFGASGMRYGAQGVGVIGDPHWNYVSGLWHFDDETLVDAKNGIEMSGDFVTTDADDAVGGGSLRCLATNTGLVESRIPQNADWAFGTEDYTVELWIKWDEIPQTPNSVSFFGNLIGDSGFMFRTYFNAFDGYGYVRYSVNEQTVTSTERCLHDAKWYHMAYSRKDGVGRLFVDGVKQAEVVDTNSIQSYRFIQLWSDTSTIKTGYMDEIRITKGVGRYVDDFTVQTAPYPNNGAAASAQLITNGGSINYVDSGREAYVKLMRDSWYWPYYFVIESNDGEPLEIPSRLYETFFDLLFLVKPAKMHGILRANFT